MSGPSPRDHFVYRVFDAEDQLLYVGCTKSPERRWPQHKTERPSMARAAVRWKLSGPYSRATARQLEATAIESEHPMHNFTSARRRERAELHRQLEQHIHTAMDAGLRSHEVWAVVGKVCKKRRVPA